MMQQEDRNKLAGRNICAVIVSFNAPEKVTACIASALQQVDHVIVIDNSSDKAAPSSCAVQKYPDTVTFIYNESNLGLAHALNQGIRYSMENGYEWSLLLDQDSQPSPGMIDEMVSSYEKLDAKTKDETAIIVPVVFDRDHGDHIPSVITTALVNRKVLVPAEDCFVHFHITSGSLIRNNLISIVGPMNQNLFIDYVDFDFCFRVLNKNLKILLSRNTLLYHTLAQTRQKIFFRYREHSPIRVYYQTRNSLFTIMHYGPKYRSFLYFELFRLIRRPLKIIILESDKIAKINMYIKAIFDFMKEHKKLDQA